MMMMHDISVVVEVIEYHTIANFKYQVSAGAWYGMIWFWYGSYRSGNLTSAFACCARLDFMGSVRRERHQYRACSQKLKIGRICEC